MIPDGLRLMSNRKEKGRWMQQQLGLLWEFLAVLVLHALLAWSASRLVARSRPTRSYQSPVQRSVPWSASLCSSKHHHGREGGNDE